MQSQEVFERFYKANHEQFIKYCHALTGNHNDAEDLASDTLLKAMENFHKIRKPESFTSFLIGIARRLYFNKLRRNKFWGIFNEQDSKLIVSNSTNPDTSLEIIILYDCLAKLPVKLREAVILFEISGFSLKEICTIQQVGLSAVKQRVSRGRMKLKHLLQDQESVPLSKEKKNENARIIACQ